MELDQLKDSWRQLDDAVPPQMDLPALLARAERSAAGPLRRMKRSVLRQVTSLVVVYVLAYTQFQGPTRVPVGIFYLVMMLTAGIYYAQKYRLLKSMENIPPDEDMVTNFTRKLQRFKSLLRLHRWITCALLLIVMWFVCALLWVYQRPDFYVFLGYHFHPGQEAWVVLGWTLVAVVLMVPGNYIGDYFLQLRYGRHVEKLEETLNELQQGQ